MAKPPKAVDWKNRIVRSGMVDPTKLLPNPQNWRTHPALQAKGVRAVLERVGWVLPVLANQRTGPLGPARWRSSWTPGTVTSYARGTRQ